MDKLLNRKKEVLIEQIEKMSGEISFLKFNQHDAAILYLLETAKTLYDSAQVLIKMRTNDEDIRTQEGA